MQNRHISPSGKICGSWGFDRRLSRQRETNVNHLGSRTFVQLVPFRIGGGRAKYITAAGVGVDGAHPQRNFIDKDA